MKSIQSFGVLTLTAFAVGVFASPAFSATQSGIMPAEQLKAFVQQVQNAQTPAQLGAAMNKPVFKRKTGMAGQISATPFTPAMIAQDGQVLAKDWWRVNKQKNIQLRIDGRAGMSGNDLPKNLVDNGWFKYNTLEQIELAKLTQAKLKETPWSDDYWAINKGVLAARYEDDKFKATVKGWSDLDKFFAENPTPSNTDELSPAEKYDLLVGDTGNNLVKRMINEGRGYWDRYKKVETWMGICHGWAPAAYMMPRPQKAISVKNASGQTINFFPADIKALGSLLWANAHAPTRFIGGRCNVKDPKQVAENGRIADQDCWDTNPASFHLALVNQIGHASKSTVPAEQMRTLVMDATFDYEVWNQPVYSYSYRYFNPISGQAVGTVAAAKVPLAEYTKDKFKAFRHKDAVAVVGVNLDVTYVVETRPTHRTTDSSSYDALTTASYVYDLEIDKNGVVIGGEWYQNKHPDFLWTPVKGTWESMVANSGVTGSWDPRTQAFPAAWTRAAQSSSARAMPLAKVVDALIRAAR